MEEEEIGQGKTLKEKENKTNPPLPMAGMVEGLKLTPPALKIEERIGFRLAQLDKYHTNPIVAEGEGYTKKPTHCHL